MTLFSNKPFWRTFTMTSTKLHKKQNFKPSWIDWYTFRDCHWIRSIFKIFLYYATKSRSPFSMGTFFWDRSLIVKSLRAAISTMPTKLIMSIDWTKIVLYLMVISVWAFMCNYGNDTLFWKWYSSLNTSRARIKQRDWWLKESHLWSLIT